MADRAFGVREINIVGSAGTPTISSPTNINLNGINVAISTDIQVGRNASIVGVITANAFVGNGAGLTGLNVGVVTYSNLAGVATYASIAGIATYSSTSGVATYSSTAGVSTVSQGLTGSPNLNVGIVTATSFIGDGSGLTNLPGGGGGSTAGINTTGTSFFNTLHATGTIDIGTSNAGVAVTHMTIDSVDIAGTIRNQIKSGAGNTNAVLDIETKEFLVTDPYAGKGALIAADSSGTKLYKDNSLKLQTIGTGVTVTGTMYATAFSGNGSGLTNVDAASVTGASRINTQDLVVTGISTLQGIKVPNDVVAYFGSTNQLGLYYSSSVSQSRIDSTQPLYVRSDETRVVSGVGSTVATFTNGVALAFNYVNKFATTGYGVTVYGTTQTQNLNVTGITTFSNNVYIDDVDQLQFGTNRGTGLNINYNGVNGFIGCASSASNLYIQTPPGNATGIVEIRRGTFHQKMATFTDGGSVDLYFNNALKFRTTDTGALITGIATVSSKVVVGTAASGIEISYDGVDSIITDTSLGGELTIRTNQLKIESPTFESLAVFNENSDVKLYFDNSEKLRTTNTGVVVTGILTATSTINTTSDVNVGIDTTTGLVLTSPNGTRFRLFVDDAGNLSTVATGL